MVRNVELIRSNIGLMLYIKSGCGQMTVLAVKRTVSGPPSWNIL